MNIIKSAEMPTGKTILVRCLDQGKKEDLFIIYVSCKTSHIFNLNVISLPNIQNRQTFSNIFALYHHLLFL